MSESAEQMPRFTQTMRESVSAGYITDSEAAGACQPLTTNGREEDRQKDEEDIGAVAHIDDVMSSLLVMGLIKWEPTGIIVYLGRSVELVRCRQKDEYGRCGQDGLDATEGTMEPKLRSEHVACMWRSKGSSMT